MERICYTIAILLLLPTLCFAQLAIDSRVVTEKTRVVNLITTKEDITKWEAYLKDSSVYDSLSKEMSFKVNEVQGCGWLLIHDGTNVKAIICVDGITSSIYTIVECSSKDDAFKKAAELKLKYNAEDYEHETDCGCK
jgi:hypothetical protein